MFFLNTLRNYVTVSILNEYKSKGLIENHCVYWVKLKVNRMHNEKTQSKGKRTGKNKYPQYCGCDKPPWFYKMESRDLLLLDWYRLHK